ncbi:phage minor head protein [Bordetella genomosp. 4]|uniref:Phage head morphogenesis protein n=1 Tax=Bordetella genomosp. 4 TaxID=463044 RepID=A0A261U7U2_9BORD|nr:phage minor head protein [Bordetella genomosp. 4]OZI57661.1 phage head morphogenesis protein [Bordetella genomosp. 4]
MARAPILPSSVSDPTGVDKLERGAINDFAKRLRRIRRAYIDAIDSFSPEPVVNKAYTFRLDQGLLRAVFDGLATFVDGVLLEGGESQLWFFETYVGVAYQRGTAQEFANLAQQYEAYKAGRQSLLSLISSEPYQARIALLRAREFEEMEGLSGSVRADMSRVLSDGLARGLNPREIATNLTEQTRISEGRANRIARTEVSTALRRARLDEADDAADRYGTQAKQMHMSALSPTTRPTHASRHAKLFTTDQQREWWAKDANSINCKCSTVTVLVDDEGKPLVPSIVDRARKNYEVMKAKGKGAWTEE